MSDTGDNMASAEDRILAGVFHKLPLSLVRGKGAMVWDAEGKEYVDCMGGYGVAIVGHANPEVVNAITRQANELITCHGSIYNNMRADFLQKLVEIAPKNMGRVFLSSSGAEAVECALKLAKKQTRRNEIVALGGGYHGKTMGALSVTWNPKYREPFAPLMPGVQFAPLGDLEKLRELVSEKTAAVILEPIQGETGIHLPPDGYLDGIRELCSERDVLLIHDEIQSGFGRTGRIWAAQHWNIVPDILCLGKGIAGGLPIGATLAKEEVMSAFKPGDHSGTFGGNPLVCAAGSASVEFLRREKLEERAKTRGNILKQGLVELAKKHRIVREVRGLGLMLAMELRFEVRDIILEALTKGVILLYSGRNILRFLPPLVIEEEQVKKVLETLDEVLTEEERRRGV